MTNKICNGNRFGALQIKDGTWISVQEKLPEDFDDMCEHDCVFVGSFYKTFPQRMISIAQRRDGKWDIMEGANSGYHSCVGQFEMNSEDITHWMPFFYPDIDEKK